MKKENFNCTGCYCIGKGFVVEGRYRWIVPPSGWIVREENNNINLACSEVCIEKANKNIDLDGREIAYYE